MKTKSIGTLLIAGLVVLSAMAVFAMPAVAGEGDPVLWVVPENPDRYDMSSQTVIDDVNMYPTFSGKVLVLNHAPAQSSNVAHEVDLKFFVYDATNIANITIGTAERVHPQTPSVELNDGSSSSEIFNAPIPSMTDPPYNGGYGVQHRIGEIPWHGNQDAVGDPQTDLATFDPDAADVYIRVPFTINFDSPPEVGFTLYFYAENQLTGNDKATTAYSHDGGYNQIPEFATLAIPMAIAILSGLFFLNHRKRREE